MIKESKGKVDEEIRETEELHEELLEEAEANEKSRRRKRDPYRKTSVEGRTRL